MVTLLRQNGFRFIINTHDHIPPHIHVVYGGEIVLLRIGLDGELPSIYRIEGMRPQNIRRAVEIAAQNNRLFLDKWRELHGR